jgi:hypothetical protein
MTAKSHSLKALPVHLPTGQRTITIIVLKKRMLSPIAQLFIENLSAATKLPAGTKKQADQA